MDSASAGHHTLVAIAGLHKLVAAAEFHMLVAIVEFHMLVATALAAVDRVRVAANNLAVVAHTLLEVVP
jgi:hypothetical protein